MVRAARGIRCRSSAPTALDDADDRDPPRPVSVTIDMRLPATLRRTFSLEII